MEWEDVKEMKKRTECREGPEVKVKRKIYFTNKHNSRLLCLCVC